MATYTITINERTEIGKSLLVLIKSMGSAVSLTPTKKIQKNGLDEALEDIKLGRLHSAKNANDLIEQCLK